MNKKINIIVACTFNGGIGFDNDIPWHIPEEMKKFKKITTNVMFKNKQNAVIMGRKTWESLPIKPLPNRINIVISSDKYYNLENFYNTRLYNNIREALSYCDNSDNIESTYIIGGAAIYNKFLENRYLLNKISYIYLSVLFDVCETNRHINIYAIYDKFYLYKDTNYQKESNEKLFASYICFKRELF